MDEVKGISENFTPHAAVLMGQAMQHIRATFAAEDWGGLRQSHFRLLSCVPAAGVSITDLAELLAMTKQGCGQFVSFLSDSGHLTVAENPDDRRARVVQRTPLGDRTVQAVNERIYRIEQEWAELVGPRRYATFRRVLLELTADSTRRPGFAAGS